MSEDDSPSATPGAESGAGFWVGPEIGHGEFGTVYEGRDLRLDRRVAIKFVRKSGEAVISASRQAKALARANHPNVVAVHCVAALKDPQTGSIRDAIVMEFVEGPKLRERLAGATLTLQELTVIANGLIDGLEHLHTHGISHDDLHDENILLVDSVPKLIDPMSTTSVTNLHAAARGRRLKLDLDKLQDLLAELLSRSRIPRPQRRTFETLPENASIADIRRAFHKTLGGGAHWVRASLITTTIVAVVLAASLLMWRRSEQRKRVPDDVAPSGLPTATPPADAAGAGGGSEQTLSTRGASETTALPPSSQAQHEDRAAADAGSCSLPAFALGAARRFLATSSSEEGAKQLQTQIAVLLGKQPKGGAWTTALHHFEKRAGHKVKWIVVVDSMSPDVATSWCRWLLQCEGWTEWCSERAPFP